MLIKRPSDIAPSDITPESAYLTRREFIGRATGVAAGAALGVSPLAACEAAAEDVQQKDEPTPYKDIISYNNFYEFGTDKGDPAKNARNFESRPWTVVVDGLVGKPGRYDLDALLRGVALQDRVYRHRCVEAWSMVVPWQGFPLRDLIRRMEPRPSAKFVSFATLHDPSRMPGQRRPILDWPYREGLRLDEAMHPLTLLSTGIYGRPLPGQNGAPLRLVVPWKYGFKGIKSIVRITLTDRQPLNTWQQMAPNEYGFYANVNPQVDHPRWSQARERRVGEWTRRPTLMFNGYGDQVASMYSGMDLRKLY